MNALRNLFLCASAAALLAACGGADPQATPDVTGPGASASSNHASAQRGDAGVKSAPAPDQRPVPILAGAATTQDTIDSAIAAHAATTTHTQR